MPAVGLAAFVSKIFFHTLIGGFVIAGAYMAALMFISLAMMMVFWNRILVGAVSDDRCIRYM